MSGVWRGPRNSDRSDAGQARRLHEKGAALANPEAIEATLQWGRALLEGLGFPDEMARRIVDDRRALERLKGIKVDQ